MVEFTKKTNSLFFSRDDEILEIEPWGPNGIRVRATRLPEIKQDWISALVPQEGQRSEIEISETGASLRNGSITAKISASGELSFMNVKTGSCITERTSHSCSVNSSQTL